MKTYTYYRWVLDNKRSDDEIMNGSTFGGEFDDVYSARHNGEAFKTNYSKYQNLYGAKVKVERVTIEELED